MQALATLITLLILSCTSICFVNAQQRCFWPNGDPSVDYPCNPAASASVCCAVGWDCLSNGLCRLPNSKWYRGSCTDQTWSSNECSNYCVFNNPREAYFTICPAGSTVGDGGSELFSYCCDNDHHCNCTTGESVVLLNSNPSIVTSIASPSPFTASSTTSYPLASTSASSASTFVPPTSTSNPTATTPLPSATAAPPSNHYIAISLGLGVPLGLAILGVIAFLLLTIRRLKKRKVMQPDLDTRTHQPVISHVLQPSVAEIQQPSIAEMQQASRSELYSRVGQALPELSALGPYAKTSRGESGA